MNDDSRFDVIVDMKTGTALDAYRALAEGLLAICKAQQREIDSLEKVEALARAWMTADELQLRGEPLAVPLIAALQQREIERLEEKS